MRIDCKDIHGQSLWEYYVLRQQWYGVSSGEVAGARTWACEPQQKLTLLGWGISCELMIIQPKVSLKVMLLSWCFHCQLPFSEMRLVSTIRFLLLQLSLKIPHIFVCETSIAKIFSLSDTVPIKNLSTLWT